VAVLTETFKSRMGQLTLAAIVQMMIKYRIGKTKWNETSLYSGTYTVRILG
jgi:hypothetical protein